MTDTIDEIRALSAYELASMADCASPDSPDSAGAVFLTVVYSNVMEAWSCGSITPDARHPEDTLRECVDSAVSVYNNQRALAFVDLCAYLEDNDIDGTAEWNGTLIDLMGQSLFQIGERLAHALLEALNEAHAASVEEGADDDVVTAVNPAEAVLTGPVDLPAVSDPILDLLAAVEAPRTVPVPVTESDTQKFMRRMAEINDGDDDLAAPFRPGKWVAVACVAVWVVVMLIVVDWPF